MFGSNFNRNFSKLATLGLGSLAMMGISQNEDSSSLRSLFGSFGTKNECCGIVGYIGNKPKAGEVCI